MKGRIIGVNGPVVKANDMKGFKMREMVMVGAMKLIGEIIILENEEATIQVYEETGGLKVGEEVISTGNPLFLKLGPGILGNMFDGIERPLKTINEISYGFIPEGNSGYLNLLKEWYEEKISPEIMELRGKMLKTLYEENKLMEIVKLVGEDVLPDDQRLIIEISKVMKISFLQQNAYNDIDTFVPLKNSIKCLKQLKFFTIEV